jgi:hypothetical protein
MNTSYNCLFCTFFFKKPNKIIPIVIPNNIQICINNINYLLLRYERFINDIFPEDINITFVLPSDVYHTKTKYVAEFKALLLRLEVEFNLINNPIMIEMRDKYVNKLTKKSNEIHKIFTRNIQLLNNLNTLQVEESLIYSKSFIGLFEYTRLPKFISRTNIIT